jgi:hypothetical protein
LKAGNLSKTTVGLLSRGRNPNPSTIPVLYFGVSLADAFPPPCYFFYWIAVQVKQILDDQQL